VAIKPNPYKLVCPKCGFSKVVAPRSDALTIKDLKIDLIIFCMMLRL
jgi:Zn finger protein HypA/HybF involved in hydrogenase expression